MHWDGNMGLFGNDTSKLCIDICVFRVDFYICSIYKYKEN